MDKGQKGEAEHNQILPSTPNDITLVNEVQLVNEQSTPNVAGLNIRKNKDSNVGDEDSDNEVEEVFG